MTANGTKTTFDEADFSRRLAAYVRQNPQLAADAYARASKVMRAAAQMPENRTKRFQLRVLADRIGLLSVSVRARAQPGAIPPHGVGGLEIEGGQGALIDVPPPYGGEPVSETDADAAIGRAAYATDSGGAPYADMPRLPTEYDGVVADMAASKVGGDGVPNTELEAAAAFQQLQDSRQADEALPVQTTPSSARPGITIFGQEILVQFGGSGGSSGSYLSSGLAASGGLVAVPEGPVVRWDGREQETIACTIALNRVGQGTGATFPAASNPSSTAYSYRPYARILWGGSRGKPNEALVDVGRGCQIMVACCFLYVNVGMDAPPSGYAAGSMWLGGTFGFYSTTRPNEVYRTAYIDSLAGGGTQQIEIPRFATTIANFSSANAAGFTLTIQDASGATIGLPLVPSSVANAIPLSGGAHYVLVTNIGALASAELVFSLSM